MAKRTVDVFVFFVNGANPSTNISRVKQDIRNANSIWKSCIKFVIKGIYFSKNNLLVNAKSISSDMVFENKQIDAIIHNARSATGNKLGIYVIYLGGNYLAEGKGKRVVGVGGTELVSFKSHKDYELFGRILLTDKAEGRYTLAHEFGHVLFKRYNIERRSFIHDDPSGPYINTKLRRRDNAHNNDQKNLMFPISPNVNPNITSLQCQVAKQSNLARGPYINSDEDYHLKNIRFF